MNKIFRHIRTCIIEGFFAAIPLILCVFAIGLLYHLIDKNIITFLDHYFDVHQIPGFGIFLLLLLLMFIGVVVSYTVGKQLLQLIEFILAHVPFINQIYALSKKVSDILGKDHEVFKKTVLINYPNANQWTIALMVGKIKDLKTGENWFKVYVPMAHPLIGFVYLVKESQTLDPGWSAEEGFKMAVSLGLISPKTVWVDCNLK